MYDQGYGDYSVLFLKWKCDFRLATTGKESI